MGTGRGTDVAYQFKAEQVVKRRVMGLFMYENRIGHGKGYRCCLPVQSRVGSRIFMGGVDVIKLEAREKIISVGPEIIARSINY